MKRLGEFFQDETGGLSSTRLAFLLWAVGVLAVWIGVSWRAAALQPIDQSVYIILGVLMTGKVWQKFAEKPDKPEEPPKS